jgi:hypothetical protein
MGCGNRIELRDMKMMSWVIHRCAFGSSHTFDLVGVNDLGVAAKRVPA